MSIQLTPDQLKDIMQSAVTAALQAVQPDADAPSQAITPRSNVKRPQRPEIDIGVNESQWSFFEDEWSCYKRRASLADTEIVDELRSTCTKELRKLLFDYLGSSGFEGITEIDLLKQIKSAAVISKNTSVHRKEFYSIRQSPGESVKLFVARLKAKAEHCDFKVKCGSADCDNQSNSYVESMIADQMTVGLHDKDIQEELLARDKELKTFTDRFNLVESYEKGKLAKSQLDFDTSQANAAKSQYRKSRENDRINKNTDNHTANTSNDLSCIGCGETSHGSHEREKKCHAWGKTCYHCGFPNHISVVCKKRDRQSPRVDNKDVKNRPTGASKVNVSQEKSGSSFFLAFASDVMEKFSSTTSLPHMEWDGHKFHHSKPPPLPSIEVEVRPFLSAHQSLNKEFPNIIHPVRLMAFTDTCAQTCISDSEILRTLNIPRHLLIPTSHRIIGVTGDDVHILGVIMLEFRFLGEVTVHVVYICDNVKGLFLSIRAQVELGILPEHYPKTSCKSSISITTSKSTDTPLAACGCLLRSPPPDRPDSLPFPPSIENRDRLEKWIIDRYLSSAFNKCVHQPLPRMSGRPLDIHFKKGVSPSAVHTPIPLAHHWKEDVKRDIDRDISLKTVEPVPQGTPTIWCSRMVIVSKIDGKPRRTVDYQKLNDATFRETHHTPSPFNQASIVPPNTKKTVLDAWNGYHSLPLSDSAKAATTFITEWGRFRYTSAPQGFHAAGDGYTRRYDDITIDVPRKSKCVDDTILWDDTIESAFWHTIDYIDLCAKNGIVFNTEKFHFAKDVVDFAGFTITEDGFKPTDKMLTAVKDFPTPTCITGVRSFFGLINQVSYTFANSSKMQPFRELLKKNSTWFWDETMDILFQEAKEFVLSQIHDGVRTFEVNRPTCLWTDWSKNGIGFTLLQKHCNCDIENAPVCCKDGYKLVFAGSRFTTDAESRYAPVEGEALAVVHALAKCYMFVLGCPDLTVVVDHKPLVKILGDKSLDSISNPRLLNLKEKTMRFNFTIKHVPGTLNTSADACSRFPVKSTVASSSVAGPSHIYDIFRSPPTLNEISRASDDDDVIIASVVAALTARTNESDVILIDPTHVKEASVCDHDIIELSNMITRGFPPNKSDCSPNIQCYWGIRNDLSVVGDLVLFGKRIVIPSQLRKIILENLHSAHQGENGMRARAATCVYWPGITGDIKNRKIQCRSCTGMAPSQPCEPYISTPSPEYPFDKVVSDYFDLSGHRYLLYADRYSGWISVVKPGINEGDASYLKKRLRTLFTTFGAPNEMSSDGGSPYNSHEMSKFLETWGVHWRNSSAHYPQSNGRAELAVKVAKRILTENCDANGNIDNDKVSRALLQYRNTPLKDIDLSPAQILFGRTLKDHTPTVPELCKIRPEWILQANEREFALRKRNSKMVEEYNRHTKSLPELTVSDHVAVQNQRGHHPNRWEKTGKIVEKLPFRQYRVRMDGSGRITLRNRRFLRPIQPICSDTTVRLPKSEGSNSVDVPPPAPTGAPDTALVVDLPVQQNPNANVQNVDAPPQQIENNLPVRRRSNRPRQPRQLLEVHHHGQTHSYRDSVGHD